MSIAPFLQKTYDIFSNPLHSQVCGWGDNNDSIVIHNMEEFAEKVLPKYFKHSKYSSFTRQLHKYDFHKTTNNPAIGEFKHPYFLKDQPDLMVFIQRKLYVNKKYVQGFTSLEGSDDYASSDSNKMDIDHVDFSSCQPLKFFDPHFIDDEIDSAVEREMISADDEVLSVLEKRQAQMMTESTEIRDLVEETMQQNNQMMHTMDMILNSAVFKATFANKASPPEEVVMNDHKDDGTGVSRMKNKVFQPMKRLMKTFKKKS